jgi:hypothetical protein
MKNKFIVLATCALTAATLALNVVYAQSPTDLLKKAAEAATRPEQQRPPIGPSSPAPSDVASPGAPGAPRALSATASGGSEMQHPEVAMVLTKSRASSWADAQKKAVTKVSDGDPLWLYIKTVKPLKEYVYSNPDDPNSVGQLELVISPRGSYTSLSQRAKGPSSTWPLRPEEMRSNEIAISLAPGAARAFQPSGASSTKSERVRFFLNFVGGANAQGGRWENEIFVIGNKQHVDVMGRVDSTGILRQMPLAVAPITVDTTEGFGKYKAMYQEDCSPHPASNKPCKVKQ